MGACGHRRGSDRYEGRVGGNWLPNFTHGPHRRWKISQHIRPNLACLRFGLDYRTSMFAEQICRITYGPLLVNPNDYTG